MKYAILVGDGMGDYPLPELGGRTPLEAAQTPHMDRLALTGRLGLVRTVPPGLEPGSDVANMSIMGYDPSRRHTGRAPLEAASLGVDLAPDDLAFRLNLVNLEFKPDGPVIMRDHSAGNIPTDEAAGIIKDLSRHLPLTSGQKLYPGVSYRHLLVWPGLDNRLPTIAPHDYRDRDVTAYLHQAGPMQPILDLIRASWPLLKNHPVNRRRTEAGLPAANSIWPWGQGRRPSFVTYRERFGLSGAVVSAVDLIKGLGVYAGLTPLKVPGATGLIDTNYAGKVKAALDALKTADFVLLHLEAPDEASHQGDLPEKIQAIENFDRLIVGPMVGGLEKFAAFRLLILCDHFTPLSLKTHASDPVPFIIWPGPASSLTYSEKNGALSGFLLEQGHRLIDLLLEKS